MNLYKVTVAKVTVGAFEKQKTENGDASILYMLRKFLKSRAKTLETLKVNNLQREAKSKPNSSNNH